MFKIESGLQLLARISKKKEINISYQTLFESGLQSGDVIEICGDSQTGKTMLLIDVISEALIPIRLGGAETDVLVIHTDGNFNIDILFEILKQKILSLECKTDKSVEKQPLNSTFQNCIKHLHLVQIYNASQLYSTILNLETIILKNNNISLLIFDTLTAYYWSEQSNKIIKMDTYLKNILKLINKTIKQYRCGVFYTRPQYFNSNIDVVNSDVNIVNYKIKLSVNDNQEQPIFNVNVTNKDNILNKTFYIHNNTLIWYT